MIDQEQGIETLYDYVERTHTAVPVEQLSKLLRDSAHGSLSHEAATELLIEHRDWLRRGDLHRCIQYWPAEDDGPEDARIDWPAVVTMIDRGVAASSGELGVLQAAASLAGHGHWPLADILGSLDNANTTAVLQAIAHLRGWHERGRQVTITGEVHAPVTLGQLGEDLAQRAYRATVANNGVPFPAWSTGERLGVALVLGDRAYIENEGYTVQNTMRRLLGDGAPPEDFDRWLRAVREAAAR